ncbi:hypothetical protein ZEAMMB73_Zm00001d033512 [Zea mays]|uniref:Uncharacterized protein n=1 Tax=Zea mays TaxID=4577 RepID=A0A1D6KZE5_MAIZE|nr:hypothetical protein ZEAMMB73_Zm00001d033512 [Zea mays]
MRRLESVNLATNRLDAPGISVCAELRMLNLARNKLVGEIPESFKELRSLSYLTLTKNSFTNLASTLQVLQHLSNLTSLVLTRNFRGGETMLVDGISGFKSHERTGVKGTPSPMGWWPTMMGRGAQSLVGRWSHGRATDGDMGPICHTTGGGG